MILVILLEIDTGSTQARGAYGDGGGAE